MTLAPPPGPPDGPRIGGLGARERGHRERVKDGGDGGGGCNRGGGSLGGVV